GLEAERAQAGRAGRECECMVERLEGDSSTVEPQVEAAADAGGELALVLLLVGDLLPLLEGRDLGHVEDVLDVDAIAGELDPGKAVDGEVPERVRCRGRRGHERDQESEQENEALHDAYLLASGLQRSEKCGFSRSALTNHGRDSCARQRSII